jgi:hypothetical protein
MKATFDFDDELYRQLEAAASKRGKKVPELVAEGVRMVLRGSSNSEHESPPTADQRRISFPIIKTKRTVPLDLPDDIGYRVELADDLNRHADSLR